VSAVSRFGFIYLRYFSKPVAERQIYRLIHKLKPAKILELGIGRGQRAQRMISAAQRYRPAADMRYAGFDLFEGRGVDAGGERITLKDAHVMLKATGVRSQLVPGDLYGGLARAANGLRDNDLVLISADQDSESLERAWFYLPRMLHANSVVLRETPDADGAICWRQIAIDQIEGLAARQQARRRVA
jgi:hypothetical protein